MQRAGPVNFIESGYCMQLTMCVAADCSSMYMQIHGMYTVI